MSEVNGGGTAVAEPKTLRETEYKVFVENEDGSWQDEGSIKAHGPKAGIREALKLLAPGEGDEITIALAPARSWAPQKFRVQTEVRARPV